MRVPIIALLLLAIKSNAFSSYSITRQSNHHGHLQASATANLSSLTVPELKERLKREGCKVSGRKTELIQRLEAVYALDTDASIQVKEVGYTPTNESIEAATNVEESNASIVNELSRLTVPQLKQLLKAQGCTVSGTKVQLVERLADVVGRHRNEVSQTPAAAEEKPNVNVGLDDEFDSIFESSHKTTHKEPNPTSGFADMNLPSPLLRRLNDIGFTQPTPIQRDAIPIALSGTDVCGLAQTGTGKTLAFGIPLVSKLLDGSKYDVRGKNTLCPKAVSALVLAPTRELANQIASELENLTMGTPVKTYVVYGGVKISTHENRLEGGVHILVATPGRLVDLVNRGAVILKDTKFLVLDESDQMLDMGFAPDLKRIANELPYDRQTMLFSATMSKAMSEVAKLYLKDPVKVEVARSGMTADKITQEIHYIPKINKLSKLTSLMSRHEGERTVIFGRTKHGMEKLCQRLNHAGIESVSIHGNKSQSQRDRAIKSFKAGDVKVLVVSVLLHMSYCKQCMKTYAILFFAHRQLMSRLEDSTYPK